MSDRWSIALHANVGGDSFYSATPLAIEWDVRQMTWVLQGTYGEATLSGNGPFADIVELTRRLGYYITIHDERGDCVWMGKVHRLAVQYGDAKYEMTMEHLATSVSIIYYKVTSEVDTVGKRTHSDWSEQPGTKWQYGEHNRIVTRTKLTEAEATAELIRLLDEHSKPAYSVMRGRLDARVEMDCKGLWYYLQRMYYKDNSNLISSPDKGGYSQNFGEGSGIDAVYMPFWTDRHLVSMIHWSFWQYDTFYADKVTVKLNKVVDGWGAAAQPTDGVVCEIVAPAANGVYFGEIGRSTGNYVNLGIPRLQNGRYIRDSGWQGVWPGLRLRVWGGIPDYGQVGGEPAPVYDDLSAFVPELDIVDFRTSGGKTYGGSNPWDGVPWEVLPVAPIPDPNWQDWLTAGPDDFGSSTAYFTVDGPGTQVLATSEVIPAAQIPTSAAEITFNFATPVLVGYDTGSGDNKLWLRFRRTLAKDATDKNWLGKGYYQLQGFTPQSLMGGDDVVAGFPFGRSAEAGMMVHAESKASSDSSTIWSRYQRPIPGSFRNEAERTRAFLGAALWFKVSGGRQTDAQLYYMAMATSGWFSQVVVESPYPGIAWGSGVFTVPWRKGERSTQDEMRKLLERGTSVRRGLIFEITPDRTAFIRYEPLPSAAVTVTEDGKYADATGKLMGEFPPPVGQWVNSPAVFHLQEAQHPDAPFFCEEAVWDQEQGMQLRPRTLPPFMQLPSLEDE